MKKGILCAIALFVSLLSASAGAFDTIVVAKDGSGHFNNIQEAVWSVRAEMTHRRVIFVKKGVYKEKVVVPTWCMNVSLVGEDRDSTILTWNDHANIVRTLQAEVRSDLAPRKITTFETYTLLVQGHGFQAENLTIENNAPEHGQAVALHVEGDKATFINCRILGNQDTIYAGSETSRQYYKNCYIEGTTDFIFGAATCFFDKCVIHSKKNSYITAPSTPKYKSYGFVFKDCTLTAATGIQKVYLGRPWRPYGASVWIDCTMGSHILPKGWDNWRNADNEKTARFVEINSKGAGANNNARVQWAKTKGKRANYSKEKVLGLPWQ